jgi:hypothetical protein
LLSSWQAARAGEEELAETVPDSRKSRRACLNISRQTSTNLSEPLMAKEQRASKNTKKPKKDAAPPKAAGVDRPTPPMTSVLPKGKLKNKPV